MSRRGDNIRKRKDGRWEGRYIYAKDKNGKSLYKSVYAKTYSEVKEKLCNIKTDNRKPREISELDVNAVAEKWLIETKEKKKYSTYIKYSNIYNKYILKILGSKKISLVTETECKSILEECCKEKMSRSTINSLKSVINQIMEYGDNPISITCKFCDAGVVGNARISIFTKDEQWKLQQFLLNDINSYKLGIYVCMLTGMRLGEICALKTESIDLNRKVIKITQTVQRIKSEECQSKTELFIEAPKTPCSVRDIPICNILLQVLQEQMPNTLFLLNGNLPMEPRTYQYYFGRILEQLSIESKNFHTLRHTFATNCIDSGMDIKCLSEILGHSDVKTTLNRYVHPTYEQKMRQINSFASDYGHINGHL